MKRILFLAGILMLFGCGMLKTSRTPTTPGVEAAPASLPAEAPVQTVIMRHVSAFTAEDLYRSRQKKIRKKASQEILNPGDKIAEDADDPVMPVKIEVIQIIDEETGSVVAVKIINNK